MIELYNQYTCLSGSHFNVFERLNYHSLSDFHINIKFKPNKVTSSWSSSSLTALYQLHIKALDHISFHWAAPDSAWIGVSLRKCSLPLISVADSPPTSWTFLISTSLNLYLNECPWPFSSFLSLSSYVHTLVEWAPICS